ncbi:MAG: hypothetical protein H0S79_16645, partial [Anaerolineaceae bacterium]|nr:hypothetical protein [Anaerolineaceae bacterium]
ATYTPTPQPTSTPTPKPTSTPQPTEDNTGYPVKTDPTQTATTAGSEASSTDPEVETAVTEQATETLEGYPAGTGSDVQPTTDSQTAYPNTGAAANDDGAADHPSGESSDQQSENGLGEVSSSGQAVLNIMLWAILGLAVLVMFGMMVIAVRRRTQKPEDYLL